MNRLINISTLFLLYLFSPIHFLIALPHDWPTSKVIVLPDMGNNHILSAISTAKKSIDLTLYHLDDPAIIAELIKSKNKGINVRVILHKPNLYPAPFENKINVETVKTLTDSNIKTKYLDDHKYTLTHYKFIIIDADYAIVQTFNYDDFNFKKARNFGVTLEDKNQVAALSEIFENDFNGNSSNNDQNVLSLWDKTNFILGPIHQRDLISNMLRSAKKSIYIYQQDLSDPEIGKLISILAKEGKKINILMSPEPFGGIDNNRINQTIITSSGGAYRFKPKNELYIHAKVILIDPEENGQLYVGSCNLWPEALSRNREFGVVIKDNPQIQAVYDTFKKDWDSALSYDEAKAKHKQATN